MVRGTRVEVMCNLQDRSRAIVMKVDKLTFVCADVRRESDVSGLVNETLERFHGLDTAFNNAGIEGPEKPIHELIEAEFNEVMNTNSKRRLVLCEIRNSG